MTEQVGTIATDTLVSIIAANFDADEMLEIAEKIAAAAREKERAS